MNNEQTVLQLQHLSAGAMQETARLVDYVGGGGGAAGGAGTGAGGAGASYHLNLRSTGTSIPGSMTPGRFVGHSAAAIGLRLAGGGSVAPPPRGSVDYAPGSHIASTIQQHASQVGLNPP